MNASTVDPVSPPASPRYKFGDPDEAYWTARRRILNNALRRGQLSLDLSNYGLTQVPPEIGQLTRLQSLTLDQNQIVELPSEIGTLETLRYLHLTKNRLISLPTEIGNLKSLERLDLSGNRLEALPSEIGKLKKLRHLNLAGSGLQRLPVGIGELEALEIIRLEQNELSALPTEFNKLISLQLLDLRHNKFVELPSAVTSLVNLRQLNLDQNRIEIFSADLSGLTKLFYLSASGNRIVEFPAVLAGLQNLVNLYLDNNQLSSLPAIIGQLRALNRLSVQHNDLRTVSSEVANLQRLRALHLENNKLIALPRELGQLRSLAEAAVARPSIRGDGLWLNQNPLPDPYPTLISPGQPKATVDVLKWLRGELNADQLPPASPTEKAVAPPEPLPESGPLFQIASGELDLVPGSETSSNFDISTQKALHRRLVQQAKLLHGETQKVGNLYPQLATTASAYVALINEPFEELDVVDLWAVGNGLLAQSISFERQSKLHTITEPLEPIHLALLLEVAGLHGGFILGFPRAVELTERADMSRVGPNIAGLIGEPTSNVLAALSRQRKLVSERARRLTDALDVALTSVGWDIARVGYTSYATVRNALIVIGRVLIWTNDKGGSLAGGVVVASLLAAASLPPNTLELMLQFLRTNTSDILAFSAPFPELRAYIEWIINQFDLLEEEKKQG